MVAVSLEQLVRNQLLLREVNERIGEVANAWAGEARARAGGQPR